MKNDTQRYNYICQSQKHFSLLPSAFIGNFIEQAKKSDRINQSFRINSLFCTQIKIVETS